MIYMLLMSLVIIIYNIFDFCIHNKPTLKGILIQSLLLSIFGGICVLSAFLMSKLESLITNSSSGKFSLFGLILFTPIFIFIICKFFKIKFKEFYDKVTISIIFTIICMRLLCIISGCCYGKFIYSNVSRYPIREIEIALNITYLLFYYLFKNKLKTGLSYPIYMIYYGIIRFILQFFRNYNGLWNTNIAFGHIWSIISIVIGVISIIIILKGNNKDTKHDLSR